MAVIRGKVLDRENQPLSGVTVTIQDHPEYGQTVSRQNGVDLTSSSLIQVARSSLSTDADGSRQATVSFPQGTQATMTLPDGTTEALTTLNVCATEYTVGDSGPKAMPAPLPPTSGYTYAVELSVDEALAAGATRVDFSRPLPVYVDNFVDFPVGGIVPAGWYPRENGLDPLGQRAHREDLGHRSIARPVRHTTASPTTKRADSSRCGTWTGSHPHRAGCRWWPHRHRLARWTAHDLDARCQRLSRHRR